MIAFLICVQIFFLITGTMLLHCLMNAADETLCEIRQERMPQEGLSWLECQIIVSRVKRLEQKRRKHVRL